MGSMSSWLTRDIDRGSAVFGGRAKSQRLISNGGLTLDLDGCEKISDAGFAGGLHRVGVVKWPSAATSKQRASWPHIFSGVQVKFEELT